MNLYERLSKNSAQKKGAQNGHLIKLKNFRKLQNVDSVQFLESQLQTGDHGFLALAQPYARVVVLLVR